MRRRASHCTLVLLGLLLLPAAACAQQDGRAAELATREGRYEEAIRIGTAAVRANPDDLLAQRALVRSLLDVGRYGEALEAAAPLPNLRGEALLALGRREEAEAAFQEGMASGGPDRLSAEFNLARSLHERGERESARQLFDRFIDYYNRGEARSAADLVAVGNALRFLGITEPALFQDAVLAFDEAVQLDPGHLEAHLRLAELFLEKYNSSEAHAALEDLFAINARHPEALLAQAHALAFDGDRGSAMRLVRQSLEINPELVPARAFLARMLLDTDEHQAAEAELERALATDPTSFEALSTRAALHLVRGEENRYTEVRERAARLYPGNAALLTMAAEIAAQQRLYARAAELAAEATRLDPTHWAAFAELGLNEFRLGRIEEARLNLERSFSGDPYNIWIKNNLDLFDTFAEYRSITLPGMELMVHGAEAELLLPYLEVAAPLALTELSERYGDRARGPVRIELYPRSADFSVRTVGLTGLGALGVSFGDVVALDSPSARPAGSYNWVATLWHELMHTVAMGITENRVPRWFTEGLSVLEERRTLPRWEQHVNPEFLIAYDAGELPPVSRLNEGFVRPRSPQHLGHAYEMASLVNLWIEETHGFEALVRMLHGYRDGLSTEEIFRRVLGAEAEVIDTEFDLWLRSTHDPARAKAFLALFSEGRTQLRDGQLQLARATLESAVALFPLAVTGSPYALLAEIHRREEDSAGTERALAEWTRYDENAYEGNLELARVREALGDRAGAIEALERAVWIYPIDPAPHRQLAELYAEGGEHQLAVRERRALLALALTDRADALYRLALALFEASDLEGARREVLRALEVAPAFEEAQELLLRVHESL